MTDSPTPTNAPKALPMATLADLEASTINLAITLIDGNEVLLPIKLLSEYRTIQINHMRPTPDAPTTDAKKVDGAVQWIKNYNDPTYQLEAAKVISERASLQLAEMIQLPIPGDDLEAKGEYIRSKFDQLVIDQIFGAIREQREKAKARVITRAETFLG